MKQQLSPLCSLKEVEYFTKKYSQCAQHQPMSFQTIGGEKSRVDISYASPSGPECHKSSPRFLLIFEPVANQSCTNAPMDPMHT